MPKHLDRPLVLGNIAGDKIPFCDDINRAKEEPESKCSYLQLTGQQDIVPFVMSGTDASLQVFIPPSDVNSQPQERKERGRPFFFSAITGLNTSQCKADPLESYHIVGPLKPFNRVLTLQTEVLLSTIRNVQLYFWRWLSDGHNAQKKQKTKCIIIII